MRPLHDGRQMKAKRRAVTAAPVRRADSPAGSPTPRAPHVGPRGDGRHCLDGARRTRRRSPGRGRRPVGRPRAGARPAQPDPRRVGDVRLRRRIRRRRRRGSARRDLLQGHHAQAAHRQPDAARDRDAGRDAQLDRAAEPGRRRGDREVRRRRGPAGRRRSWSTSRANRSTTTSRSRAGSTACRASPGSSSTSAARTSGGRAPVRDRRLGRGRGHGSGPPRHRPAAPRQAVAERRRHPPDREGDRRGRAPTR